MIGLLKLLARRRTPSVRVRPATGAEVATCARFALDYCREQGRQVAPGAEERLAGVVREQLRRPEARLLVAERRGEIAGMVCGAVLGRDVWDDRVVYMVDWWYVAPEHRDSPDTALALLRAVVAWGLAQGAQKARVVVNAENQTLLRRYVDRFGFRPEWTEMTLALEVKER